MGRRNARIPVATWEVETYLVAEERLMKYLDSGVDAEAWERYLPWLEVEKIRKALVLLFKRLKAVSESEAGTYEVSFGPDLPHFFWFTHRFVFDREHDMREPDGTRRINHPLESMGLPYYVALWSLAERVSIWNSIAKRIVYTKPSL